MTFIRHAGRRRSSDNKDLTMPIIQGGPGRGRYLVSSGDSARLSGFVAEAERMPDLQLLHTIGPQGAPHTAVYEMPHATAALLSQRFAAGGDMKIEPDQPLSMFGDTPI